MKTTIISARLTAALLFMAFTANAVDASVTFTRVADTHTIIPAGQWSGQPFTAFVGSADVPPAIDNGNVMFLGTRTPNYAEGVYKWENGTVSLIADPSTPRPGGGSFSAFKLPSVQGGTYAFSTYDNIYCTSGGTLTSAFGSLSLSGPGRPSVDGNSVWFYGEAGSSGSIYRWNNGSAVAVISPGQPMPGAAGLPFTEFGLDVIAGQGNVAFYGANERRCGLYKYADNSVQLVADTHTSTFDRFLCNYTAYDGQTLGFLAHDVLRGWGLFLQRNGELETVLVEGQAAPGGGNFQLGGYYGSDIATGSLRTSIDAGHIAFSSFVSEGSTTTYGIYTDLDGELKRLIGSGDKLFGETVDIVRIGEEGLSGNQIAFLAHFTDGNEGIFVATVPEPSTFVLLGVGVLSLFGYAWGRRRA
ncbi:MAG: PEP-CTERM sorting domain-containing protein [Planctomycetaceae bacterium]|nr:PEP-CTERM sorting domain-containing protein [Planctomycetaceae bacterium]